MNGLDDGVADIRPSERTLYRNSCKSVDHTIVQ